MALPLVLVPGLLCSAGVFAPQVAAVWPFGQVTVADHRQGASIDAIAARILADAPPRFALAGLSMGGYIAFAMQRLAPERVARLALLDTSARADNAEQITAREETIAMAEAGRFAEVVEMIIPCFLHKDRLGDETLKRIVREMAADTGVNAFVRQQKALIARIDSRPLLTNIKCPTLVLVGDGDMLTPLKLSQEIANGISGAQLVVLPDCGHLSTLERPEAVDSALAEWLAD
jgi:pimeloyl-ACP methyl ester carboxylesterase